MAALRAVFFGSPAFAVPSLRAVAADTTLVAVVSQPDRPAGRGQAPSPPPVKVAAAALGVPVIQPEKVRTPETEAALAGARTPTSSSWSLTAASCRSGCWICRGSAPTTSTRRCCPSCAAPRRSSGRSSGATRETGVLDHAHGGGARHRAGGGGARAAHRRRRHGRDAVREAGRARARGCSARRCPSIADGAVTLAPQDDAARDAGAAADEGGRPT